MKPLRLQHSARVDNFEFRKCTFQSASAHFRLVALLIALLKSGVVERNLVVFARLAPTEAASAPLRFALLQTRRPKLEACVLARLGGRSTCYLREVQGVGFSNAIGRPKNGLIVDADRKLSHF